MGNKNLSILLCLFLAACGENQISETETITGGLVGVWSPQGEPKGNIILHQGHDTFDGRGYPSSNLVPIAEKLAQAGYAVYGMEMPQRPHDGRPLSDFTAPVINLLNTIGPSYMIGLSGGGWTTTVVTSMDTRIIKGFSIAGDAPLEIRPATWPIDAEQLLVDYRPVYDKAGERLVHIYNFNDPCCFSGIQGDTGYTYVTDYTHAEHKISEWAAEYVIGAL